MQKQRSGSCCCYVCGGITAGQQQQPLPCAPPFPGCASGNYEPGLGPGEAGIDFDSLWCALGSIQNRMLQDEEEEAATVIWLR